MENQTINVGINGFGRIGRNYLRAWLANYLESGIEVVTVNDLDAIETSVHLLKYDSVLGPLPYKVEIVDDHICIDVDGVVKKIAYHSESAPEFIPWNKYDVQLVIESTGVFTARGDAARHQVDSVLISAPSPDADYTVVLGVNDEALDPAVHKIISNASCTTNCLAPIVKVLDENFGIVKGSMLTVHSYTNDQGLLDAPHSDLRRARAAAVNIVPTTTGAAKAVGLVLPHLKGKLDGYALRVPTVNGSVVDFTVELSREVTRDTINRVLLTAAESDEHNVLRYTEDPIVSSDILGDPHSSIIDSQLTWADGTMAKVVSWYDNEAGYTDALLKITVKICCFPE